MKPTLLEILLYTYMVSIAVTADHTI